MLRIVHLAVVACDNAVRASISVLQSIFCQFVVGAGRGVHCDHVFPAASDNKSRMISTASLVCGVSFKVPDACLPFGERFC